MPDTDPQKKTPLTPPKEAYEHAADSPVYRLSELMFGSLLASYVLGFIGFLVVAVSESRKPEGMSIVEPIVQYTSISITYAYLTASMYLSYHAGILTMPHMPLKRLGFDFLLALAISCTFGFSMIYPVTFPCFVGVVSILAFFRQLRESNRLVRALWDEFGGPSEPKDPKEVHASKVLKDKFAEILRDGRYQELSVWEPAGRTLWFLSLLLVAGGLLFWYMADMQGLPEKLRVRETWRLEGVWITFESAVVLLLVSIKGHFILKQRATFLYDRKTPTTRMDTQFDNFRNELRKAVQNARNS